LDYAGSEQREVGASTTQVLASIKLIQCPKHQPSVRASLAESGDQHKLAATGAGKSYFRRTGKQFLMFTLLCAFLTAHSWIFIFTNAIKWK